MEARLSIFTCFTLLSFLLKPSFAIDTIASNQNLTDTGETLVSAGGHFELGFFSPWNSNYRYIGIWFKNVPQQTVFWVANKNNPLTDSSGVLMITATGNVIILRNQSSNPVWFSNSSATSNNPVLQLLDTGNLVVKDVSSENYLWQSFDYPCDTLIPGMKLGWSLQTGDGWYLSSWRSLQDPSTGDYTYKVDHQGLPQLFARKGTEIVYRSGPWDGLRFGGSRRFEENAVFNPLFVSNTELIYYSFENLDKNTISRFVLNQSGVVEHVTWNDRRGEWAVIMIMQTVRCDEYALCGPNGFCDINRDSVCYCPFGFTPRVPRDWNALDWSEGCVARTSWNCSSATKFFKFTGLKLPDHSEILDSNSMMSRSECEQACLRNCSCVAYAKVEVSGCVMWFGSLIDVRQYSREEYGKDLYVRMDASEFESNKNVKRRAVIISISVASGVLLLMTLTWCYLTRKRGLKKSPAQEMNNTHEFHPNPEEEDLDLPLFDWLTVASATNDFAFTNKIGEGGFGPVYRGKLQTGQEIAVKRLSKDSGQGLTEFKNEVIFIAKLQHRNLVRLLGCCIYGEERMLIYEYMPNRSLDRYIFDKTRGTSLNWQNRYDIINGIARGLLYLHRDSRLRIIHRDLKASNILLDGEMNPRISDFGLARTFGGDQSEANTSRIIGTYGYMSPEYAIEGLFSVKSDVFSFGVLVLEIVSGKRNRGFYHPDHDLNLLGHAWKLWNGGTPMEMIDPFMEKPVSTLEVLRCIQVGLLCVQQRPEDRPTMSSVLLMLDSENPSLPQPKQPGFYTERFFTETDTSSTGKMPCNSNEITISMLQGR
ncbi:PREDICTED: G-type lectin S-receptor-like serine/threonine-protein kinase At4g27290 isoform X1 [Theobroma cacao]|uniref:Receptor-like serine/threonine-protein kinase n=1 Tax=Theobroma cacao TaxID=3641 RepID=A0AB32WLY3_THECC|nr:PREDICTED: G-type lectin S-receptor-like serine/threonine-protein kinase At4g27290 isoform X1 [Theobroma cacao]